MLDVLTDQPTEWVARLAPPQSRGWRIYADYLLGAGHRRIALAAESSVYWAAGARILRDHLAPRGGTVIDLDARALTPTAVCDALVDHRATAILLLTGFPEFADRARMAEAWPRVAIEGTRGPIRFSRAPGISVWQWATAPIQVVDRDPAAADRLRILHASGESAE